MRRNEWVGLAHYQGHEVSPSGEIRNAQTKQVMRTSINQSGVRYVSIRNTTLGKYENRAVGSLVAETFCVRENLTDETVLHLDGNTENNAATNLMWATRWHAMAYHSELQREDPRGRGRRIQDQNGTIYRNAFDAARHTGCLPSAIDYAARYNASLDENEHLNFAHRTYPGGHVFRYA